MTRAIEWEDSFDVGVKEMNDEHKVIINLIGELVRQHDDGEDFKLIEKTLEELGTFTVKHFKDEEAYMESVGYPELKTHKIIHTRLLNDFAQHANQINMTQKIPDAFIHFLNMWLTAHIKGIDMKYNPEKQNPVKKAS